MTTVESLKKAKNYIERGWCKNFDAINAAGLIVDPQSSDACQWCMRGAIAAAARGTMSERAACRAILEAIGEADYMSPWNDQSSRTKPEVLAAFDRAIAAEQAKQPA